MTATQRERLKLTLQKKSGMGLRLVMAFLLVSLLFCEVEYDWPSLNLLFFGRNSLLLDCEVFRVNEVHSLR